MRVLLINPPLTRYDRAEIAPPLALLSLAREAKLAGHDAQVLDLNLPRFREWGDDPDSFYDKSVELVACLRPDQVGITSMGVNSHVAIELANQILDKLGVECVLGGVHASNISDYIENDFPLLAVAKTGKLKQRALEKFNWISSQKLLGQNFKNNHIRDFYEFVDLEEYFSENGTKLANYESGVGCKYRCDFCYRPNLPGEWFDYPPEYVAQRFLELKEIGFEQVFLVQDNLVNDYNSALNLGKTLIKANSTIKWKAYATFPELDTNLLDVLNEAGCNDLYVGVDVTEKSHQREWHKSFLKNPTKLEKLIQASSIGLTCAFILDPNPDRISSLLSNIEVALSCVIAGASVRFSMFDVYPGSNTEGSISNSMFEYTEWKSLILSDIPKVSRVNAFARLSPHKFPWHSQIKYPIDYEVFVLAVHITQTIFIDLEHRAKFVSGRDLEPKNFWLKCNLIAKEVLKVDAIHKTELRNLEREVAKSFFDFY